MKGRIIGREGRNIRALENLTGVDFIIDDTPNAVVLSAFDGVRREIARMTLEQLLQDGRIHPARIEETYYQAKSELEAHIDELGEQAVARGRRPRARPGARAAARPAALPHLLRPERARALGRVRAAWRRSWPHELGASAKTARRAALLHDIGKAVSHEIEGPHALVGGDLARRHGETEAVAHAMEAHHNEVEPQTVEAVIVQAADALSGARPGARGESLEHYVKRLRELEQIATRHDGRRQGLRDAGRARDPRDRRARASIDDAAALLLARTSRARSSRSSSTPGQIKVTVIRESRAVDYAK